MNTEEVTLYSGGLKGTEAAFGECAEQYGLKEITYSFLYDVVLGLCYLHVVGNENQG